MGMSDFFDKLSKNQNLKKMVGGAGGGVCEFFDKLTKNLCDLQV